MLPPSLNPTSFATILALSCICLASWGSVHSLFTSCIFLCFPSSGTSHLMYNSSLSSTVKSEVNLLARNSLSRFNALILHIRTRYENSNFQSSCKTKNDNNFYSSKLPGREREEKDLDDKEIVGSSPI